MSNAEPPHLKWLRIIIVVRLRFGYAANLADLPIEDTSHDCAVDHPSGFMSESQRWVRTVTLLILRGGGALTRFFAIGCLIFSVPLSRHSWSDNGSTFCLAAFTPCNFPGAAARMATVTRAARGFIPLAPAVRAFDFFRRGHLERPDALAMAARVCSVASAITS